ncbi:VOC family protein [Facklamia lactis]|uniref:VOC family protein n=1 Tax=Facklamia lactis TaxID=2749967 RepID=UPI0018CE7318|nr:VOC family protein [Facklamia lactis]MBG9981238.1 VOC family protein [Facklamia lactis]
MSVLVSDAHQAHSFYHQVLGMKLLIKIVNQENPAMYHLFYGDQKGRAGTEFTIFEMKDHVQHQHGTKGIDRVVFLVSETATFDIWTQRFDRMGVRHQRLDYLGQEALFFEDPEGMRLGMVKANQEIKDAKPFLLGDIPREEAIIGIGQVHLRVVKREGTCQLLEEFLGFVDSSEQEFEGFPITILQVHHHFHQQVHLIEDRQSPRERLGVEGMHHVAFGLSSEVELEEMSSTLLETGYYHTGKKDREFFQALYFREDNQIVFELSTSFHFGDIVYSDQEQKGRLGDLPLRLPNFMESDRSLIENFYQSSLE